MSIDTETDQSECDMERRGRLRSSLILTSLVLGTALSAAAQPAKAEDRRTSPGVPIVEPPTLIALGFEWPIQGDANRNATAELSYRKAGATAWRQGLPLLRIGGEEIRNGASFNIVTPNMFAGSVFDLEPGTAYEVRLRIVDPDGVTGEAR